MRKYERVTFRPAGARARTVILDIRSEGRGFLTGIEVDKEGDEVAPKGHDERLRIIDLGCVTKRVPLRWDLFYGELVDATTKETHG